MNVDWGQLRSYNNSVSSYILYSHTNLLTTRISFVYPSHHGNRVGNGLGGWLGTSHATPHHQTTQTWECAAITQLLSTSSLPPCATSHQISLGGWWVVGIFTWYTKKYFLCLLAYVGVILLAPLKCVTAKIFEKKPKKITMMCRMWIAFCHSRHNLEQMRIEWDMFNFHPDEVPAHRQNWSDQLGFHFGNARLTSWHRAHPPPVLATARHKGK